jgi:hypothetical protein
MAFEITNKDTKPKFGRQAVILDISKGMGNPDLLIYAGVFTVMAVASLYLFYYFREKKELEGAAQARPVEMSPVPSASRETLPLRLQAYERLVLLTDRIALQNLVTRIPAGEMSARQYQALLVEQIRAECDHNITQQIYVEPATWDAVMKLREQNIFIVNRLASTLPEDARGTELSRYIVELLNADPDASLHDKVRQALHFEARKLMQ